MANQCLNWLDKLHTHTIGSAMVPHFTHSKNKNLQNGLQVPILIYLPHFFF